MQLQNLLLHVAAPLLLTAGTGQGLTDQPVQRGDAEMAQKLWRVVRACVELGEANPLQQIHDQGAGGNCNVVSVLQACNALAAAMHSRCWGVGAMAALQ